MILLVSLIAGISLIAGTAGYAIGHARGMSSARVGAESALNAAAERIFNNGKRVGQAYAFSYVQGVCEGLRKGLDAEQQTPAVEIMNGTLEIVHEACAEQVAALATPTENPTKETS